MQIIELKAENIKRLKAVEIRPDGNMVTITGRNGQGKTSVLDSIYWALAGGDAVDDMPIRKGEKNASIKLDLGEFIVERRFTPSGTTLNVESKENTRFKSPQTMLDRLVGSLSFDPLEFVNLAPKAQAKMLRDAIASDVDFDELESLRAGHYDQRRDLNRDAKRERASADSVSLPDGDVPQEKINLDGIVERGQKARAHNELIHSRIERRDQVESEIETLERSLSSLRAELQNMSKLAEPVDLNPIQEEFRQAQNLNELFEQNKLKSGHLHEAKRLDAKSEDLTNKIKSIDAQKASAIASANLPVDGLSWAEDGITLNEIPFDQASTAEQIKTSVAIAMSANPEIRVIRIKEGSLLDKDSMRLISDLAQEHGFQVWIETISSDDPAAIVIEDGQIQDANAAA